MFTRKEKASMVPDGVILVSEMLMECVLTSSECIEGSKRYDAV